MRGGLAMAFLFPGVTAAAVLSFPAPRAAADATEDAVRAFRRAYDARDSRVRRKAVGLLDDVPGPAATAALLPALADDSSSVRERARDVLASRTGDGDLAVLASDGLRHPEVEVRRRCADALAFAGAGASPHAEPLSRLLRDRDPTVRESAAAALGATGHRGQASVVAAALRKERVPEVRGALLLALHLLDAGEAAEEARRTAARDRDGPPCTAALRVLGASDPAGAVLAARGLLDHGAWEVRIAAAGVLGREGRDRVAVEALLGALRREERTRVLAALGAALEKVTGVPLGEDPDRWRKWWDEHGREWSPRTPPPGGRPPPPATGDGHTVARFYDIPVDGDRLAFVIDTSRSMTDPARLGEEATKMQLAIAEIAKTLGSLRTGMSFNLVAFDTEVRRWQPRSVPATPGSKHEALRFLQKQQLEGRTNIFDALAAALEDPEVDTAFLLTDGAPSAGEETGRTGFLHGLAHLRRWRPVRVHCVEVGRSNTGSRWRGFLEEVAAAADGIHVAR